MVVKIVTVQSRGLKRIEKFVFKSGSFDLGRFCVVFINDVPRVVKALAFEKKHMKWNPIGMKEGIFKKLSPRDMNYLRKIELAENKIKKTICEKVKKYNYPMKIVFTEYSFDMKKIYIYFWSFEHLDLFILVKKIFENLKLCVEFKHISRREFAKFMGGIGVCGRSICCNSFLVDLKRISSKSIVNQELSTDSPKFAGLCGCLMCCLEYEEQTYFKERKDLPKVDDIVKTPKGNAIVLGVNVISQVLKVSILDSTDSECLYFKFSEVSVL